jgi:hypothetical protein
MKGMGDEHGQGSWSLASLSRAQTADGMDGGIGLLNTYPQEEIHRAASCGYDSEVFRQTI